jgi:signal transduction histidine kinase
VPAHLPEYPLSTEARHHLFLAVKEALNNVVRHSGASEVWLRLGMDNGDLKISVDDNGQGIRPPARPASDHNGLGNIRRRLEGLGGRFELCSQPSTGTSLVLRLPLPGTRRDSNPQV